MDMDIWLPGYLHIWFLGYLDKQMYGYADIWILMKNNLLLHLHSEILCGAARPGTFCQKKTCPWCFATQNSVSSILPEQGLPGLGYIDAD